MWLACGWHCISCVAGAFATGDCVLRRAPTVTSSSSMLCGGICGSFPSLYMRHPMLNRLSPVVHLPICTPHPSSHQRWCLSSSQPWLWPGKSGYRPAARRLQGGNDCGQKLQCNESAPKSISESNPNSMPPSSVAARLPMRCNFPSSRFREGNMLQPSLPTTTQPYFNTAH